MSPELAFIFTLGLRMAITAAFARMPGLLCTPLPDGAGRFNKHLLPVLFVAGDGRTAWCAMDKEVVAPWFRQVTDPHVARGLALIITREAGRQSVPPQQDQGSRTLACLPRDKTKPAD